MLGNRDGRGLGDGQIHRGCNQRGRCIPDVQNSSVRLGLILKVNESVMASSREFLPLQTTTQPSTYRLRSNAVHSLGISALQGGEVQFLGLPVKKDGRRVPPMLVLGPGRKVLRGRGFSSVLGFGGRGLATKGTATSFSGVICSIDRPLTCTKLSSRAASRAFTASLTRERATNFPKKASNSVCSAAITQSRYFDNSADSACCTDRFTPSRTASGDQRFSSSQYDPSGTL